LVELKDSKARRQQEPELFRALSLRVFEFQNSAPASVFIVKPSSLGDVVHTLPAVALVKKRWPQAELRWLVNPEWAPLLAGNPHIDEVVLFPRGEFRGISGLRKVLPWARSLPARRADLVLDFQGLLRSALISRLVRGRCAVGLSDAREGARFFYDRVADVAGIEHAVDRYLQLVRTIGIDPTPPFEWPLPPGEPPAEFSSAEPFILVHPFSRGAGKSLTPAQVEELCRALAPRRVVLVGRTSETVPPLEHVTDLLNRTNISELIWLIRQAAFVVSVDSGPMHIAAALTPRLLSIHTWSDPRKVGPYCEKAWIWKNGSLFQQHSPSEAHPAADLRAVVSLIPQLARA
jgi:ADP-heptose:LPS heptosyltransferase